MNHTAFFKVMQENRIGTCYVFEGKEEYIKESALEGLKKKMLPQGLEVLNFALLENPAADEIIAAAQTLPFMADKRLIVVKNPGLMTSGGKTKGEEEQLLQLEDLLKDLPSTTCLVFYIQGKADGRKKLSGFLKKNAEWIEFNPLGEGELYKWIGQSFRSLGKQISPLLAQELAFTVGNDTMLLKEEIGKIASFMGEEAEVSQKAIKQMATPSLEFTVFDMVDALVGGKQEKTFRLQKQLLQEGGERLGILAMILRQYRMLLFSKGMDEEKKRKDEIRTALGIPAFAVDKTLRQAGVYTMEELKEAVSICLNMEFAVKSGKIPQEGALEQVTLKLLTLKG